MKNRLELPYFYINGEVGGNQDWFMDAWMHIGGCGALTACDFCIQQALHAGKAGLVPAGAVPATRREYSRFGMIMKPYLRPRMSGIDRTEIWIDGFQKYLDDAGETGYEMDSLEGGRPWQEAAAAIRDRIAAGIPVPILTLKHRDPALKDFEWHWYPAVGFEGEGEDFVIKVATYGEAHWLHFRNLWETGYAEKGGIVLIRRKGE